MNETKKISPTAILALKEALSVIFWKKTDLKDFVRLSIDNPAIIGTIDWSATKRESINELVDRMSNRQDLFRSDLMNLLTIVTDFNDFSHLTIWDEDGSKTKKAKQAVLNLRNQTKGYFQITKEQEEAKLRKAEADKNIQKAVSLESELIKLKELFFTISANSNFQQRGYQFEKFLYELFLIYDLEPKESFKVHGEQIDGAFTFQGNDFILEAKWKSQVNRTDLATFCAKVEAKFKTTVGLLVTIDGVTPEAISPFFKSIIIMDGSDIMAILDGRVSLTDLLFKKRRKASETGNIFMRYSDLI
ncbi:restriction endonuclease [Pedobacter heparinus]|uniref:restriction endonuclease n=1 Tax=Pedobacter heparinus TaxID=984 RepID=UPI002931E888|nr:restriction endonuclease [Pedobacter heparinus]